MLRKLQREEDVAGGSQMRSRRRAIASGMSDATKFHPSSGDLIARIDAGKRVEGTDEVSLGELRHPRRVLEAPKRALGKTDAIHEPDFLAENQGGCGWFSRRFK